MILLQTERVIHDDFLTGLLLLENPVFMKNSSKEHIQTQNLWTSTIPLFFIYFFSCLLLGDGHGDVGQGKLYFR